MSTRDEQLLKANWDRINRDIERAAVEFQRTADALREIPLTKPDGTYRTAESVISQAALVMNTSAGADLIHRLATWAESINDVLQFPAGGDTRCGHTIEDPTTVCVLGQGHTLPTEDGLIVHVSADGVKFS